VLDILCKRYLFCAIFCSAIIVPGVFCSQQEQKRDRCDSMSNFTVSRNAELSKMFHEVCRLPTVLHSIVFDFIGEIEFNPKKTVKKAHDGSVDSLALLDDKRFASLSGNTIKIWNINPLKCIKASTRKKGLGNVLTALSPHRLLIHSYGSTGALIFHDVRKKYNIFKNSFTKILPRLHVKRLVTLSHDRIALCEDHPESARRCIKIFKIAQRGSWPSSRPYAEQVERLSAGAWAGRPYSLAVLPNDFLASGSCDGKVRIWDPIHDKCLTTLNGHTRHIIELVLLPQGELAVCGFDGSINIVCISDGACLRTIPSVGKPDACYVQELQLIGDQYLVALYNEQVKIWNSKTGECVQSFNVDWRTNSGYAGARNRFIVGPDNQLIMGTDSGDLSFYSAS